MSFSHHWRLNPNIDYLNHGSFGAAPRVVLDAQRALTESLERDPIRFLAPERELIPKLDRVRARIAELVNASAESIGFVRNATDGVNAVLRSMDLQKDEEVLITNHGYNACNNAVRFATERSHAHTRTIDIPFPIEHEDQVVCCVENAFNEQTKLLVIDHVTSPTGLVFPIKRIIELARKRDIRVLVDGAHAPGMIAVDLEHLQPDYYTANHHKWLCAPKASGFLYVDTRWQNEVRPTVISHGANCSSTKRSRFLKEFDWVGTYDPTPILSVPYAIDFLEGLMPGGLQELMQRNREHTLRAQQILADSLKIEPPAPATMIGSLASVPLPFHGGGAEEDALRFQRSLYDEHRIEVPIFRGPSSNSWLLRISIQAYNDISQIERLANVM
ncbi:MAG: aminotransferase class V-fold PLP-dependent enzyme [Planctomycetota bacterium]